MPLSRELGARLRYALTTLALMALLYAAVYQPYAADSAPGRALALYLRQIAQCSAWLLGLLGEQVTVRGAQVFGRFSYVVVLDCAALDAQALYAAAVLAYPARWGAKLIGLVAGLVAIAALNVGRLAILYFAGIRSIALFQVLHEEVLVFAIVACVCVMFVVWLRWAHAMPRRDAAHAA
jgi:exosortase/archaeosortase family protein